MFYFWHTLLVAAFIAVAFVLGHKLGQKKAAEVVYYTIVAGLAVYSGIGAVGAFKGAIQGAAHGGSFSLGAFEAAMATIKSGEVVDFLGKLGLKA